MSKLVKTASGKTIDMDAMRLKNEDVIAVGNMKVNARGDELGRGGVVQTSRNDRMKDYYKSDSVQENLRQGTSMKAGVIGGSKK